MLRVYHKNIKYLLYSLVWPDQWLKPTIYRIGGDHFKHFTSKAVDEIIRMADSVNQHYKKNFNQGKYDKQSSKPFLNKKKKYHA